MSTPSILYEDNHLLVVEKPANLPVQADASGDPDLLTLLKAYVKERYNKPGEAYVGLVHRLDRPVGGVMAFARTSKAAARLSAQFAGREARKRYVALACGQAPPQGRLSDFLIKDDKTFSSRVADEGEPGAKHARLSFALLARQDGRALLDVLPETGRPHQIRVQLMNAHLPLWGDQRYNPQAVPGEQIGLWAYALTLRHPTLGEEMTFFSAPQGAAWEPFGAQIRALPAFKACRGVYEDASMLVVDKHAGVEVETDLLGELTSVYGPLFPVHRLDANTEGLVALARDAHTRDALEARFSAREVEKLYHAVTVGAPDPPQGRLSHFAVKDADGARVQICSAGTPGAKRMALTYRTLETRGGLSLVEILLETGRTHQIRVQLAHIGCPVLGDDKYGDRTANRAHKCRVQQLLAKRLTLAGHTFESLRELTL